MATLPPAATNETEPRFKTEKEIRDWYSRADAGTLHPPMTPEEARQVTDELIAAKPRALTPSELQALRQSQSDAYDSMQKEFSNAQIQA